MPNWEYGFYPNLAVLSMWLTALPLVHCGQIGSLHIRLPRSVITLLSNTSSAPSVKVWDALVLKAATDFVTEYASTLPYDEHVPPFLPMPPISSLSMMSTFVKP